MCAEPHRPRSAARGLPDSGGGGPRSRTPRPQPPAETGGQASHGSAHGFRLFLSKLQGFKPQKGPFQILSVSTSWLGLFNQTW